VLQAHDKSAALPIAPRCEEEAQRAPALRQTEALERGQLVDASQQEHAAPSRAALPSTTLTASPAPRGRRRQRKLPRRANPHREVGTHKHPDRDEGCNPLPVSPRDGPNITIIGAAWGTSWRSSSHPGKEEQGQRYPIRESHSLGHARLRSTTSQHAPASAGATPGRHYADAEAARRSTGRSRQSE